MSAMASLGTRAYPARWAAVYALGVMMFASLLSFLDRGILNSVVPAIEHDLRISDTQISILQGFSFTIFYSVMSQPFGWMADRVNRVRLIAFGIAGWSLMTVLTGLAHSYPELLVTRMGVGVGEATLMPASASLIADYFAPHQRGRAYGIFTAATFLGGGLAGLVCGAILRAFEGQDSVVFPIFGAVAVWQSLFIFIGVPGLVLSLVMLTVRETKRASPGGGPTRATARSIFAYIGEHRAAFSGIWAIYLLVALVAFAVFPWAATMMVRKFLLSMAQANLLVGPTQMIAGLAGCILCGILGDRWTAKGLRGGKLRLPVVSSTFIIPTLVLFTLSNSIALSIAGLALYAIFNALAYASATAIIQDMVPAQLRGRTTALWYLVTAIGNGAGPLATAAGTDYVFRNPAAVNYAILLVAVPSVLISLALSIVTIPSYDRARQAAAAANEAQA
jgi:MFS family permease